MGLKMDEKNEIVKGGQRMRLKMDGDLICMRQMGIEKGGQRRTSVENELSAQKRSQLVLSEEKRYIFT